jgi:hypothetical protein
MTVESGGMGDEKETRERERTRAGQHTRPCIRIGRGGA